MEFERISIVVFLSRLLSVSLGFVGTIYYARKLGPSLLGTFFLLQSLVGFLSVPGDLGVQGAIEKRISEGGEKNQLFSASVALLLFSYFTISMISSFFASQINDFLGLRLFWELLAILLVSMVVDLFLSVLRGELKIGHSALLDGSQSVVTLIVTVSLLLYGMGIHALIYGIICGKVLASILAIHFSDLTPQLPKLRHLKSIYSFSKYNVILRTSGLIYGWADTIVIGLFLSNSLVGIYEVAWRISSISMIASASISQVIFPNFSELHSKDDLQTVSETIPKAITYSLLIPVGVFFGSLIISREVLSVAYGPAFGAGALVLIILAGERTIHSFHNIIYNITLAFDQPDIAFRISLFSLCSNVVLNIILVPTIGIEGAAIGMLIAYILNAGLYYRHARQQVDVRLPAGNILWMLLSGGVMATTLAGLTQYIKVDSVSTLIFVILIGGIVYTCFLFTTIDIDKNVLRVYR